MARHFRDPSFISSSSLKLTCGLGRDVVNGLLDGLDFVSVVVGDLESEFLG